MSEGGYTQLMEPNSSNPVCDSKPIRSRGCSEQTHPLTHTPTLIRTFAPVQRTGKPQILDAVPICASCSGGPAEKLVLRDCAQAAPEVVRSIHLLMSDRHLHP